MPSLPPLRRQRRATGRPATLTCPDLSSAVRWVLPLQAAAREWQRIARDERSRRTGAEDSRSVARAPGTGERPGCRRQRWSAATRFSLMASTLTALRLPGGPRRATAGRFAADEAPSAAAALGVTMGAASHALLVAPALSQTLGVFAEALRCRSPVTRDRVLVSGMGPGREPRGDNATATAPGSIPGSAVCSNTPGGCDFSSRGEHRGASQGGFR